MDSIDKLSKILSQQRCTLLGIGPMSKNCVDAVADITNSFNIPLMLIASKRQIEAKRFGGGYVNNWTTESFSEYVKDIDKKNNIILCRDHGGPWQNSKGKSKEYGYNKAIEDAKKSYEADICSDFKIIHIDPSEGISKINDLDIMLERIFDLYDFCFNKTTEMEKKISFEISIGKEDGGIHTFEEVEYAVSRMEEFCMENNFPLPLFLVVRTGNEVRETQNTDNFSKIINGNESTKKKDMLKIIDMCNKKGIMIKEHNTDYLPDSILAQHPDMGIRACNVAPEFGVTETRAFLSLLKKEHMDREYDKFLELAFLSNKWKKWMYPNTNAGIFEKAVISGHYIFSTTEFIELKNVVQEKISTTNVDEYLTNVVKDSMLRYLRLFKMIN